MLQTRERTPTLFFVASTFKLAFEYFKEFGGASLIAPKWDMEFHVDTNVSNLVVGTTLAQNPTKKCDQPITYTFRLLNNEKKTTPPSKGKHLPWFVLFINLNIILWERNFFSMLTHGIIVPRKKTSTVKQNYKVAVIIYRIQIFNGVQTRVLWQMFFCNFLMLSKI